MARHRVAGLRATLNAAPWWVAYAILTILAGPWALGVLVSYWRLVLRVFGVELVPLS